MKNEVRRYLQSPILIVTLTAIWLTVVVVADFAFGAPMNPLVIVIVVLGFFVTTVFAVAVLMRTMKSHDPKSTLPRARARRRRS